MNIKLGEASRLSFISLFQGVDALALEKELEDCAIEEFEPGQIICKEGEYDENCHVILAGEAMVALPSKGGVREKKVVLKEGEVFGEIAAMSGNPRTADITAQKRSAILNIPRARMFHILDKFGLIKSRMDALYRERALKSRLLTVPIFSGVEDSFIEKLAEKVSLVSFNKDDVIFQQDDQADALYIVRYGFVKVNQRKGGKERVLAYLKEGHCFGEMALIKSGQKRMATVSAINNVEVIKISAGDFNGLVKDNPGVLANLKQAATKRMERNTQISQDVNLSNALRTSIEAGVIQAKALLIMDTTKCVQCDTCVAACAAMHGGKSRLVRNGARINQFMFIPTSCRNCEDPSCMSACPTGAITRDSTGEIYHKDFCVGCGSCAKNCPYGNITIAEVEERRSFFGIFRGIFSFLSGAETAVEDRKAGNGRLPGDRDMVQRAAAQRLPGDRDMAARAEAGQRKANGARRRAVKCDMCREFTYMGCVYNCPTGAAKRVDPSEFFSDLATVG